MVDLRRYFIPSLIREAKNGYKQSAKEALHLIGGLIKDGEELPIEATQYLSDALEAISSGKKSSSQAFYLKGRKNIKKFRERQAVAEIIHDKIKTYIKAEAVYFEYSEIKIHGKQYCYATLKAIYNEHKPDIEAYEAYQESYDPDDEK